MTSSRTSPTADPGRDPPVGLVLTGGGARSAYQVGVLSAVARLLPREAPSPFRIVTGMSAGAIVAAAVACHSSRFREGVVALERVWRNFHVDQVFKADRRSMVKAHIRWVLALVSAGRLVHPPESMFDSTPLKHLLERHYDFRRMREAMARGHLDGLAIAASSYRTARSLAFIESRAGSAPRAEAWERGVHTQMTIDHLLASSAVPFLFPALQMGGEYFGDGAMRQIAPLSPAIRLGAERLFVVGVRGAPQSAPTPAIDHAAAPSVGQIVGFMLDTLFIDSLHSSLAQLERLNRLIEQSAVPDPEGLRRIEALVIVPRANLNEIAARHARAMPRALRALFRTMGAANVSGSELLSYLLFEASYTRELIALGHEDAMAREDEIRAFIAARPSERTAGSPPSVNHLALTG
ncbi:MAG TPA: patatin-like phospholipase family protein [Steroidobacteraceae bacterium]|nr:patatin-like phospholipase family protein [Steroidobacteraceae bacterium]